MTVGHVPRTCSILGVRELGHLSSSSHQALAEGCPWGGDNSLAFLASGMGGQSRLWWLETPSGRDAGASSWELGPHANVMVRMRGTEAGYP